MAKMQRPQGKKKGKEVTTKETAQDRASHHNRIPKVERVRKIFKPGD